MLEVFSEAIRFVNLPFTAMLSVVVIYWLFVLLGALDLDMGAGGDADADVHHDGSGGGWFGDILKFVNIGEVPVTLIASLLILCLWTGSMLSNYYLTGGSILLALLLLIPNLIVSLVVTRYVTLPLRPFFRYMMKDHDEQTVVVGQTCLITTLQANDTFGQAQIETKGAPLILNVRTMDGSTLQKGAPAVVVRADHEKGIYYIADLPKPELQPSTNPVN